MWNKKTVNTGTFDAKIPRYKELAVPRNRVDQTSKHEPFKVKKRALSYQITDSLNKLAQPKRCPKDQDVEAQRRTTSSSKTLKPKSENDRNVARNVANNKYSKS